MDRVVREGGPSSRVKVGKGWELVNRYEEALFVPHPVPAPPIAEQKAAVISGPGRLPLPIGATPARMILAWDSKGKVTSAQARRAAARGDRELFDASSMRSPLTVRALRAGDRIRPFGLSAEKRVKEILIDRKVPREERWGRPVVCDAEGEILWIPGVVRSGHAPVTTETKRAVLLKMVPMVRNISRKAPL
jgi:tRNA(Ile)-lysidine synthase